MKRFFCLCLVLASSGFALDGMMTFEQLEAQVRELQEKVANITAETELNTNALVLRTANPDIEEGSCWFATADILYWHPKVGGTAFAYSNSVRNVNLPVKGRAKKIDFDWEWGFRIGLGRNFCHDQWDAYVNYTRFRSTDSTHTSAGLNSNIIPLKGAVLTDQGVGSAKSHFDFDFDSIDLELGRHFFLSQRVSLRPFIGLKTAWIDLDQVTRYTGGAIDILTAKIEDGSDFWGIGPRLGMNSQWDLYRGFRFVGDLSGSMLYGHFDVDRHERLSSSHGQEVKLSADENRFLPVLQLFLGFGYGTYLHCGKLYFTIDAGYEAQYWWRANQMLRVYEYNAYRYANISEDISMHGLTIKLRLEF